MSFLGTGSIPECAKSKHWPSPRTYDYDSPLCPGGGAGGKCLDFAFVGNIFRNLTLKQFYILLEIFTLTLLALPSITACDIQGAKH